MPIVNVCNCAHRKHSFPTKPNFWVNWIREKYIYFCCPLNAAAYSLFTCKALSQSDVNGDSHKIILSIYFCIQLNIMNPYSLITLHYEWWPCHQASGVYLPQAIIHPTRVWILYQPCDYTGGVITHCAHHELKRIMRFVNKRQPFWQQLTHLPSSMVSFDRCV